MKKNAIAVYAAMAFLYIFSGILPLSQIIDPVLAYNQVCFRVNTAPENIYVLVSPYRTFWQNELLPNPILFPEF